MALQAFLDNNAQNGFLPLGMSEEQRMEIARLTNQNDQLTVANAELTYERKRQCYVLCVQIMKDLEDDQANPAYKTARRTQVSIRKQLVDDNELDELHRLDVDVPHVKRRRRWSGKTNSLLTMC